MRRCAACRMKFTIPVATARRIYRQFMSRDDLALISNLAGLTYLEGQQAIREVYFRRIRDRHRHRGQG